MQTHLERQLGKAVAIQAILEYPPRRRGIVRAETGSQTATAHQHASLFDELAHGGVVCRGQAGSFNFLQLYVRHAEGRVAARAVCR